MSQEHKEPDCFTCIRWDECENAVAGRFCAMWQSRIPDPQGPDPNELWEKGEDVNFD